MCVRHQILTCIVRPCLCVDHEEDAWCNNTQLLLARRKQLLNFTIRFGRACEKCDHSSLVLTITNQYLHIYTQKQLIYFFNTSLAAVKILEVEETKWMSLRWALFVRLAIHPQS